MKIAELVDKSLQQGIYKLILNGRVLGFRVKIYNSGMDSFQYFDFDIDLVKSSNNVYRFLQGNQSKFECLPLKEYNGRYYTSEELRNSISVAEFTNSTDAVKALARIHMLYERGYI